MFKSQWAFTKYFLRGRHTKIIKTHILSLRISKHIVSRNVRAVGKTYVMDKDVIRLFLTVCPQGLQNQPA